MRRSCAGLLAAVLLSTGCYAYVPADPADAARGADVRVHIGEGTLERLRPPLAAEQRTVDGRLLGWEQDRLVLELSAPPGDARLRRRSPTQTVQIPRGDILSPERKRLDRLRTAGLVAALAGAATAALIEIFSGESGGDQLSPEPDGPGEDRVPAIGTPVSGSP